MFDSINIVSATLAVLLVAPARAQWTLSLGGSTGVAAMQMTVATETNLVVIDKFEQNSLRDSSGKPSMGAIYSTTTNTVRALNIKTNSFCATGTWLSNGTLVNIGGNPRVDLQDGDSTGNGIQGMRLFNPCDNGLCDIYENPQRIRLTSSRWYPSSCRLSDGSSFIYGGAYLIDKGILGGWTNFADINNPTYEFYPPKNIHGYNGLQIPSQFLKDSLPHNMFPHVMLLPDNQLFIAANNMAMKFNWETNTESRLPNLPNGQRVTYPMSGAAVLLPLTWENDYKPEVALFGGSQLSDTLKDNQVSSQSPTCKQVSRMVLDPAGIAAGWSTEEMPEGRIMPDATLLPDGRILIINGAKTGTAGYGNVPNPVGQSNADNPAFTPMLYDPAAPAGSRFSSAGMPTSNIARLYHSISTLLPDGRVMIAGSNPNLDVSAAKYKTEYQVEYLHPPYMTKPRPSYTGLPKTWNYGQKVTLPVQLPGGLLSPAPKQVDVVLMDLGFSTHVDMRMVKLKSTLSMLRTGLTITGPPNAAVYPPGPAWVFLVVDGVPSKATKVLIGTGGSPPVDQGAINNMLANTNGP